MVSRRHAEFRQRDGRCLLVDTRSRFGTFIDGKRVVVTGAGAVTPLGLDVPSTWRSLVAGRSGIDRISTFDADAYPVNIAGEVRGFDPAVAMSVKEARRTGRDVHMGVAAALEAVADAGFQVEDPPRTAVIVGSCVGGMAYTLEQQRIHDERGPDRVSPQWIPNMLPDTTSAPSGAGRTIRICGPHRPQVDWPYRRADQRGRSWRWIGSGTR